MSEPRKPGDEVEPGTEQAADHTCPRCAGTGRLREGSCPDCDGTGTVTAIVGDA